MEKEIVGIQNGRLESGELFSSQYSQASQYSQYSQNQNKEK